MYDLHRTEAHFLGAAIGAVSSLIGGERANRARAGEAEKERQFSSGQADRQMRFQERMRNTEWQAGVADLEAAGLNPALAYQQGGASSPGGAAGRAGVARQEDVISPALSSAMQIMRMQAELGQVVSATKKIDAEAAVIGGKPTRVLSPLVDKGLEFTERAMGINAKDMAILQYEIGRSVRRIGRAVYDAPATIGRILRRQRR